MNKRLLFMAKARAIADSITKNGQAMHKGHPTGAFGEDYNSFRNLVYQDFPNLAALLPPEANVENGITYVSFGELCIYCEQIFQLLASVEESEG